MNGGIEERWDVLIFDFLDLRLTWRLAWLSSHCRYVATSLHVQEAKDMYGVTAAGRC